MDRLHLWLGNHLLNSGDLDGAEQAFRTMISINPNSAPPYIRLSYVLAARKDFSGAVQEMKKAVDIHPKKPEYYVRLGEWLVRMGDLQAAERAMMKAIEIKPNASIAPQRLQEIREQTR